MRIVELTKKQFDEYAITNPSRNFYQTSQYGTLMSRHGFKDYYVALINDNNQILGASLILIRKLIGNFKCAYSPRGFLIDFNNYDLVTEFVNKLRGYLLDKGILYLKIDPYIIHIPRNKKGLPINSENNGIETINFLKSIGFEHTGFNLYFENLKPRWNAVIDTTLPSEQLFNSFDKTTRTKIRKAKRKGVTVFKGNKDDVKMFYSWINRKHTRPLHYYLDAYDIFGRFGMIDLYFAKLDPETYLKNSKLLYENELRINAEISEKMQQNVGNTSILNKKMESDRLLNMYKNDVTSATKMYQANKKGIMLATNAIIKYGNEIFFLIDGINNKFRSTNANYLLKWKIIEEYRNLGYTRFHLNGITGDFNLKNKYYGLFDFKTGFNANVTEYIGEFNLILNRLSYKTYKNLRTIESFFGGNLRKE